MSTVFQNQELRLDCMFAVITDKNPKKAKYCNSNRPIPMNFRLRVHEQKWIGSKQDRV